MPRFSQFEPNGRHLVLDVVEDGQPRTWHWLVVPFDEYVVKVFGEDNPELSRTDQIRAFTEELISGTEPPFECLYGSSTVEPAWRAVTLGTDILRAGRSLRLVPVALRSLGYKVESPAPLIWETQPRFSWPDWFGADSMRSYSHPGVRLNLAVGMKADSVAISIRSDALCASRPGGLNEIEESARTLAAEEVVLELEKRLRR